MERSLPRRRGSDAAAGGDTLPFSDDGRPEAPAFMGPTFRSARANKQPRGREASALAGLSAQTREQEPRENRSTEQKEDAALAQHPQSTRAPGRVSPWPGPGGADATGRTPGSRQPP